MSHIFILPPIAIGDSVVANPLLKTVKANRPDCSISVLSPRSLEPLFRLFPGIDRLVTVPDEFFHGDSPTLQQDVERALIDLQVDAFDLALDLLCTPPCRALMTRLRAREKVGIVFDEDVASPYSTSVPLPAEGRSVVDTYLDYARALNMREFYRSTALDLSHLPLPSSEAGRMLQRLNGRRTVGLLLAGGDWHKRYPHENVTQLIASCPIPDCHFLIIFGPSEEDDYAPHIAAWRAASRDRVLCAQMTIPDTIHLMNICVGLIGNDCGFMHIAAALDLPILALFGPSESTTWFPYHDRRTQLALVSTAPCRPCYGAKRVACTRNVCMVEFRAKELWERFLGLDLRQSSSYIGNTKALNT